jgi:hypothetical protein
MALKLLTKYLRAEIIINSYGVKKFLKISYVYFIYYNFISRNVCSSLGILLLSLSTSSCILAKTLKEEMPRALAQVYYFLSLLLLSTLDLGRFFQFLIPI